MNDSRPIAEKFNAVFAPVLMEHGQAALLHAANTYIIQEGGCRLACTCTDGDSVDSRPGPLSVLGFKDEGR